MKKLQEIEGNLGMLSLEKDDSSAQKTLTCFFLCLINIAENGLSYILQVVQMIRTNATISKDSDMTF